MRPSTAEVHASTNVATMSGLFVGRTSDLPSRQQQEAVDMAVHALQVDGHALGFLPVAAYWQANDAGRLLVLYNNGDAVGQLVWGMRSDTVQVYQIWVRHDARQILHGRALIDSLEDLLAPARPLRICLWCAEDLPANLFWQALGFHVVSWRHSPRRTSGRKHLFWRRDCSLIFLHGVRTSWHQTEQPSPPTLAQRLLSFSSGVICRRSKTLSSKRGT